jgi:prepilin-type N-terminal cleavage/methylation domain-containing protein/prepilin-type processing-associated H-X9-DG protein
MGRHRTHHRAFSLTELIVTIGIIAALLALLMPALAKARKVSRSTTCKARLEQLGAAVQMYLNENKTRYPKAPALPSVNPNKDRTIPECLGHYVGDVKEAFDCPADDYVFPVEGISYYYYNELGEVQLGQTFFWQIFKNSSQVPMLWDTTTFHGTAADNNWLFIDGHVEDHFVAPAGAS